MIVTIEPAGEDAGRLAARLSGTVEQCGELVRRAESERRGLAQLQQPVEGLPWVAIKPRNLRQQGDDTLVVAEGRAEGNCFAIGVRRQSGPQQGKDILGMEIRRLRPPRGLLPAGKPTHRRAPSIRFGNEPGAPAPAGRIIRPVRAQQCVNVGGLFPAVEPQEGLGI